MSNPPFKEPHDCSQQSWQNVGIVFYRSDVSLKILMIRATVARDARASMASNVTVGLSGVPSPCSSVPVYGPSLQVESERGQAQGGESGA
jgi:hypothetical protein